MKGKKKSDVAVLLDYAGSQKGLTFLGLALAAVSMLLSMVPYIGIWLVTRDLIAVARIGLEHRTSPDTAGWRLPSRWPVSSCTLQD